MDNYISSAFAISNYLLYSHFERARYAEEETVDYILGVYQSASINMK